MEAQATAEGSWQEALDPRLAQRLLRPVVRPGLAGAQLSEAILARIRGLTERLPLLGQVIERYGPVDGFAAGQGPIVYAGPRPDDVGQAGAPTPPPETSPSQSMVAWARAAPPAGPLATQHTPLTQRATEAWPAAPLPAVQATFAAPADRGTGLATDSQRAAVQRALAATKAGVRPIVRPRLAPPIEPGARRVAGRPHTTVQLATGATPSGVISAVQRRVRPSADPADRAALVTRPTKGGYRQGPAATSPARPLVGPSRSAARAGVIQRSPDRPVVAENLRPGWSDIPRPRAFRRLGPSPNPGEPVGHRAALVVQRAISGSPTSPPVSADQGTPPIIQRTSADTEVDLEELIKKVERELDMEALAARVQRQLRRGLAVESERRGWVQWP
jgi:hypothetical protein